MITVGRLAPGNQWDQNLLDRLFANQLYPTGLEFRRVEGYPNTPGAVVIIPGRYWAAATADIAEAFARYEWVLAIRTGDEEDLLDIIQVEHPNIRWWVQTPRTDREYGTARRIPIGYPPHFNDLGSAVPERDVEVFLSAQQTHARRCAAFAALAEVPYEARVQATSGFTLGIAPGEYVRQMCQAKVAPAPSGAVSPDSFRLWEALEAQCVPIADDLSPVYDSRGYWKAMFPDAPFPIIADYADLPGYIGDALRGWPHSANVIAAWWIRAKRQMARNLRADLEALGAEIA